MPEWSPVGAWCTCGVPDYSVLVLVVGCLCRLRNQEPQLPREPGAMQNSQMVGR